MIDYLVIFLIRKKFKLKKYQAFQFSNQKSEFEYYLFVDKKLYKVDLISKICEESHVSLNWLLDDKCKIIKWMVINVEVIKK